MVSPKDGAPNNPRDGPVMCPRLCPVSDDVSGVCPGMSAGRNESDTTPDLPADGPQNIRRYLDHLNETSGQGNNCSVAGHYL